MYNQFMFYFIILMFCYSSIFAVYFFIIAAAACLKQKKTADKDFAPQYKNLAVIVYSHNNEQTASGLLEQLKKQDYPKDRCQLHFILDSCTDNSSNKLEFIGGAKLWRFQEPNVLGRDKTISWVLENLLPLKSSDAYVFLNADRIVKTDFLYNINAALADNSVITGASELFIENADFYTKVSADFNKFNNEIIKQGRARLGLAVPIDSNIAAANREVLEKVKCIDFKDADSELKYSFLLTKINCPPIFARNVKTYISSKNYEIKRPDFLFKMSVFFHCFSLDTLKNIRFAEFLMSLFVPNPILTAVFALTFLLLPLVYYEFDMLFIPAAVMSAVLSAGFGISLFKTKQYSLKHILYLICAPVYTITDTLCEITLIKKLFKRIKYKDEESGKTRRMTVPVSVTNGRSIFPCTLELISGGGKNKAVFRYKNKKQASQEYYSNMSDAVKNISDILDEHGFRMQICRSCAYFSPKIDGADNMFKGYCNQKAVSGVQVHTPPETLLWKSCGYFIPQEVSKVIDILKFIKK